MMIHFHESLRWVLACALITLERTAHGSISTLHFLEGQELGKMTALDLAIR